MDIEFEDDLSNLDLDSLEKKLFQERKEMVSFAEQNGHWQLFDDEQSIESMRKAIQNMDDSDIKVELRRRFNRVELLYDRYTARIVQDVTEE